MIHMGKHTQSLWPAKRWLSWSWTWIQNAALSSPGGIMAESAWGIVGGMGREMVSMRVGSREMSGPANKLSRRRCG